MKRILVASIIGVLLLSGCTQAPSNTAVQPDQGAYLEASGEDISTDKLIEDLDFLISAIEDVHPNPYAYIDKDEFYGKLDDIKAKLDTPMNNMEFYKLVSPLIGELKDGHTNIRIPKEYKEFMTSNGKGVLPLKIDIRNGKAFINSVLSNNIEIPAGAQLNSINDISMDEIIPTLLNHETGKMDSYKEIKLQRDFNSLLWLEYGFSDSFEIDYTYNDKQHSLSVDGIKKYVYDNALAEILSGNKSNYSYKIIDGICYLDFRSFSDIKSFKTLLEKMFKEIKEKNVENLIIDIRENGGGNSSLGDLLISYIYDKYYFMFSKIDIKISKQILEKKMIPEKLGMVGEVIKHVITPYKSDNSKEVFDGRVCLLTSRYTFSSATDFSSVIKDFNMGVIIGEETGGIASSYGDVYSFNLPNTKISCGVSYKYFVRPNGDTDLHGILPDIEMKQDYNDTTNNIDTVLEYTKKFIKEEYDAVYAKQSAIKTLNIGYFSVDDNISEKIETNVNEFFKHTYNNDYNSAIAFMADNLKAYFDEKSFEASNKGIKELLGNLESIEILSSQGLKNDDILYEYHITVLAKGDKSDKQFNFRLNSDLKILQVTFD